MAGEKVWLSRCGGYEPGELLRQVEEAFTALSVWEEIKPGMKVVLKPNLVMSSKPEAAIATHPALVAAVGRCVQKAGGEVLIAESPRRPLHPRGHEGRLPGLRLHGDGQGVGLCPVHPVQKPGGKPSRGQALPAALGGGALSGPGLFDRFM